MTLAYPGPNVDAIVARIEQMMQEMHEAKIEAGHVAERSAAIHREWLTSVPQTIITETRIVKVF